MLLMKKILIIFLLIALMFSTNGCYTLRKKFTRQKKYQKEQPVYVGFKDYPNKPTKEAYLDYYLFVRGWLDDLVDALQKGTSLKREKRAIDEAIMNMEQIIGFFNQEGKEKIYPLYEDLSGFKKEVNRNPNTNDVGRDSLIRGIEHFKRQFEAKFNFNDAQQYMDLQ
jgi:hypothetical protein